MVRLLVYIKHHLGFVWHWIECLNSFLFTFLYGKKLNETIEQLISNNKSQYSFKWLQRAELGQLADFFSKQPASAFEFFKPHAFDQESLKKKNKDHSFIMIGVFDGDKLIGYCFLRCFFNKQCFRGKIVDPAYQGRGIAKQMGIFITQLCQNLGFRLFATISKKNVKSIASSKAVNTVKVLKELPDDYLYVEYLLKDNN